MKTTYVAAVSSFPNQLPFEIEEERSSSDHVQELKQVAETQASIAQAEKYRIEPVPSQDGKVAIHPPAMDTPQAKAAADRMEQMNRESGAYLLVTDLLETGEIKEGRPSRADALLTAKTLWRERKGSNEHIEMQDGTIRFGRAWNVKSARAFADSASTMRSAKPTTCWTIPLPRSSHLPFPKLGSGYRWTKMAAKSSASWSRNIGWRFANYTQISRRSTLPFGWLTSARSSYCRSPNGSLNGQWSDANQIGVAVAVTI